MKISKGVEWAAHAASLLSVLPKGRGLRANALAHYHGVPSTYMAKQMQALSKAGITVTAKGARGGYRLAKPPSEISLWDITAAIEGNASAFRCTEIRQNGPCRAKPQNCKQACPIAKAYLKAETAFRDELRGISLADIGIEIAQSSAPAHISDIFEWIATESV